MESVVDGALAFRLGHPDVEPSEEAFAFGLDRKIDNGGGSAPGCGPRAGFEVVRGEGASERKLHMGMRINPAGNNVLSSSVDDLVCVVAPRM